MNCPQREILLTQSIQGDRQAFSKLIEGYYPFLYCIAFKWIGNRQDAEDITQKACIKVGQSIGSFRRESQFSTWLYWIVLNTAKDFQRQQPSHYNIDDFPEISFPDQDLSERNADIRDLWHLVNRLSNKQRDAVFLLYGEDLSHAQVASVMKCKESTVSRYIHEAKKQLKTWIASYGR